jgi:hypothetical protein
MKNYTHRIRKKKLIFDALNYLDSEVWMLGIYGLVS